jgi:hypothetical protein
MKKGIGKRELNPSMASLREMPEVDFSAYRIRKNPYAARIAREGVEIVHHGPSKRSLAEMPEVNFAQSQVHPSKYAVQAMTAASKIQYGKGRPPKGSEVGPTPARSIRLPKAVWKDLEDEARDRATTVHALLREVVLAHLSRPH